MRPGSANPSAARTPVQAAGGSTTGSSPRDATTDPVIKGLLKQASKLQQAGRIAEAAELCREAVARAPTHHLAQNNLAMLELAMGRVEEAIRRLRLSLSLCPDAKKIRLNLAFALHINEALPEAVETYREVLRRDPANREARKYLGMLLLASGDFSAFSWDCYAAHRLENFARELGLPHREWDGTDPSGKSVLVYGHQGLGDEINFASCVPDLVARGARVTLACTPRLVALFRRSFPQVRVVPLDSELPALRAAGFEFQVPLGRLGRFFRLSVEDFPRREKYLSADERLVDRWRGVLTDLGTGLKIGISWRGGNPRGSGAFRSLPLRAWEPVLKLEGAHWVSLQYGDWHDERRAAEASLGAQIHHWQDAIDDYSETAALVSALDLVISVTTSVVHLAGALGKEAWVLLNARPHWRWGLQGDRMPWYASLRLFRQRAVGDWSTPVAALAAELRSLLDSRR
jgi:ADP-heptose:LPS heptosyltransferase